MPTKSNYNYKDISVSESTNLVSFSLTSGEQFIITVDDKCLPGAIQLIEDLQNLKRRVEQLEMINRLKDERLEEGLKHLEFWKQINRNQQKIIQNLRGE